MSILHYFLWLNNITLYRYTTFYLSIHCCIFVLFLHFGFYEYCWYKHSCTSFWVNIRFHFLSLGVELLDQKITPCFIVWGISRLFSKVAALLYIPATVSHTLHILTNICCYLIFFFISTILRGGRAISWFGFASLWWLVMSKTFSFVYKSPGYLREMPTQIICPVFNWVIYLFITELRGFLYILDMSL